MLDLTPYDAIIFDMDGTLVDSMGSHLEAWRQVCERFDYHFDHDYMHSLGGIPTLQTVKMLNEQFNQNHDPRVVADFKREVWNAMDHCPTLIPDTVAVLDQYIGQKKLAVGTGSARDHAVELLTHHGILPKLNALVTATDVHHGKPHPETFLQAASQVGVAPEKCVVFEDTHIGLQAAQAAGMACVLVVNGKIVPELIVS